MRYAPCSRTRRRIATLASILLLVACGGPNASETGPAEVFREFAQASRRQDGDRLWELISTRMKADISRQQFTSTSILRELRDDYGPVAGGPALLDVELGEDLALAALEGSGAGPGARATVLRREDDEWRVQLSELDLVYGAGNLDFQVNAPRQDRDRIVVRAWVDGMEANVRRVKDASLPTLHVRPEGRLTTGRHSVVAFVEARDRSGAIAWTFE